MPGPGAYLIGEEEKKELLEVIEAGHLSRYGKMDDPKFLGKVMSFEREFANKLGASYCVATSSGTASLQCCLAALGIGAGDEVIVPGYTFIASMSSILLMNAIPVFAEIDESLNIDPADIEKKITSKTKAIIAVHMLGNPCDMDSIMKIAKKYNLYVIEDCCQACGASYKGKYVGTYGDISAFSFNFYKVITAGDGEAVITNDEKLYIRAFAFHDQGHNPYRIGQEIGYRTIVGCNFRMNELSGAVMLAQLRKLDNLLNTLREKKKRLKEQLKSSGIKFRVINDENGECATLLTLLFDSAANAEKFCTKIGASVIASSGWHVYNNMEHILSKRVYGTNECPYNCHYYGKDVKYSRNMLPKTDDILSRAVNISVGVVDKGLGANFGIDITTDNAGIDSCAQKILTFLKQI